MKKLTKEQILLMHKDLISQTGGSYGVRDEALLDSAIAAPFHEFGGKELFPTIQFKAARLCYGLVKNHAMVDGNKRIGAHSMLVFLSLNNIELEYDQKELYSVIFDITNDKCSPEQLLSWILTHQC